jgi:hypothetical protein
MFKTMKLVTKEDFSPGTVVVVSNGIFDGIAVVFDKIVWAELAQTDICKEQIEKVLKDGNLIPLRTLGGIKGPTGKPVEYVDRNIEPNASVIRNYIYSNVGGDIWIVEDPTSLREAYFFFKEFIVSEILMMPCLIFRWSVSILSGIIKEITSSLITSMVRKCWRFSKEVFLYKKINIFTSLKAAHN